MNKQVESELLETNNLNDFRRIIIKHGIITTDELSQEALEHYNKLGNNHSAKEHTDPRKQ